MLARFLEQGETKLYRSKVRGLRWDEFWSPVRKLNSRRPWWWLFPVFALLSLLQQCGELANK
jgi:hypothetical protein